MSTSRLEPGPDHPITITPAPGRVTARWGDTVVASSDEALVLLESTYPPVFYIPLDDVDHAVLQPSSHATYCPYKGDASYYSLRDEERSADNAVWTYREPYDAVAEIADHVAFYPQHVTVTTD